MAVVSKVPVEVLSEIFYVLCKDPITVCDLNNSNYKEDFPWAVGLVCRQWRNVFLSYPPIWTSLMLSDRSYFSTFCIKERSESYANEINRRLALYLERSAGYPLQLDVLLWSKYNKTSTMVALKMLSSCSHRWRIVTLNLSLDWQVDSILPCKGKLPILEWLNIGASFVRKHAQDIFKVVPRLTYADVKPWDKNHGWILPWAHLTVVLLTFETERVIQDGDLHKFLPALSNVKELRFRFLDDELELVVPQFAPILLSQLRTLEVPHPAILSWVETPPLCNLYFSDYAQDDKEPLDVREQVSSLIQRSGCKIRKLAFISGRIFYTGILKDVEELEINHIHSSDDARFIIDASSLPNLRLITIICSADEDMQELINTLNTLKLASELPQRNKCSPIARLERVTIELLYNHEREEPKIPKGLLKMAKKWPLVVLRSQRL